MKNYSSAIDGIPGIMPGTGNLIPPFDSVEVPNPIQQERKSRREIIKNLPKRKRNLSHKKQKKLWIRFNYLKRNLESRFYFFYL